MVIKYMNSNYDIKIKTLSDFLSLDEVDTNFDGDIIIECENPDNRIRIHYVNTRSGKETYLIMRRVNVRLLIKQFQIEGINEIKDLNKPYIIFWFEEDTIMRQTEVWCNCTVEVLESAHYTSIGWKRQDNTEQVR